MPDATCFAWPVLLCALATCTLAQERNGRDKLTDHGVAVPLAERRGVVTTQDAQGHHLVIACSLDLSPRGWILVTDVDSGQTTQIHCPKGVANSAPYGSLMAANGKFYTTQGKVLLEFDPALREWTFHGVPSRSASAYLSFTEGPDGTVWAGNVYTTGLVSLDPKTKEMKDHGRLDDAQKYLSHLAVDDEGWVYGGIGTARCNIVAYSPGTGAKVQAVEEAQRKVGTARVYRGADGNVYGQADLKSGRQCYRLYAGKAEVIGKTGMGKAAPTGAIGWGHKRGRFPDGRRVVDYNMIDKWLKVLDRETGMTQQIDFDYESEGSVLRVLTAGPDGKVYGNSAHPSRGVVYDPATGRLEHLPGAIARKGFAVQGQYVVGGHYGGGKLYVHDTAKPWRLQARPATVQGAVGAKRLMKLAQSDDGKIDYLSSHDIVLFRADDYGGQMHVSLDAPQDGPYYLIVAPYQSPGYGQVRFHLDGTPLGKPFVGYDKVVRRGPHQVFGPKRLAAGPHRLSIETMRAEGGNPWIGVQAICLTRQPPDQVVTKPEPANPRLVATYAPDINVPWGAAAHSDGRHVMISGPPGYGYLGGGIGIYNLETDESTLLTHEQLVPHHSIMAMAPLDNGDIACGTTVSGGHGSTAVAKEAVLFILDWRGKKIRFQEAPVPGAKEVALLAKGGDGRVYGLAGSTLLVFDPEREQVVHTADVSEHGGRTVNGMACGPDGNIYIVFSRAIVRMKPGSFLVEKIADTPGRANAGIAVVGGRVYFAVGSHLWSARL